MRKLAILATHPIQYQIPWFRALSGRPDLSDNVFYSMLPDRQQQGTGFGMSFEWYIPMFEGYAWEALENRSRSPGLGHFFGTNTRSIYAELMRGTGLSLTGDTVAEIDATLRRCSETRAST